MKVDHWTVRFDTHSSGGGASSASTTYTRVRASCSPKEWFRFEVLRRKSDVLDELSQSLSSRIGNLLGMQDIEVGYPDFDREFIVKGDDVSKVHALFANPTIRELIQAQRSIQLQTRTRRAPVANRTIRQLIRALPIVNLRAEEELHFEEPDVITDGERLKSLSKLFAETLIQLREIGAID